MAKWTARVPVSLTDLFRRLGISLPVGVDAGFDLTGNIIPVSIVDSGVILSSISVPPLMSLPFTQGELAAPLANALLADSGAQAVGNYTATILLGSANDPGDIAVRIVRRNAADAADIWSASVPGHQAQSLIVLRLALAAGEFLRLRIGAQNTGAGSIWQGSLWLTPS